MPYGFPDIVGFYDMLYGTAGVDLQGLTLLHYGGASGMVFSGNPPYTVTDFLMIYPKFFGPPTKLTGLVITQGSAQITGFTDTNIVGLASAQLVVNLNAFPKDTLIVSVAGNTITLSNPALVDDTILTVYETPFLPLVAILTYTMLALASVMYARFVEAWPVAMSLFIAHYCTMYMRSESGDQNITASQVASSGLTKGIIVSRAAGDVSASSQIIDGYDEFGAWRETQYGELFITMARAIAMGPVWVP